MPITMDALTVKATLLNELIEKEGYGLDLIDRVRDRTGGKLELKQGSIYPALREMQDDGYVTSREADPDPDRGGRPRRIYKLTAEGRRRALENVRIIRALVPQEA